LEAIKCLRQAADHICAAQGSAAVSGTEKTEQGTIFFSILKCLAESVEDLRKDVRGAALETLFEILCQHSGFVGGSGFQIVLTDIIEPLFKSLHDQLKIGGSDPAAAISASLYLAAVKALTRLFEVSLAAWPPASLERALGLLDQAASNATVATAARECIRTLVTVASEQNGLHEASVSLLKAAAKDLPQNGGYPPSEISTTAS